MSRIGKKPIQIPTGIQVQIEGSELKIKGPKGELKQRILPEIKVEIKDNKVFVSPQKATKNIKAFWGLTRALINNAIDGVAQGYEKKLVIEGIGFKAFVDGDSLVLSVGFTHPVKVESPEGVKFSVEKNVITITGADKEKVTQIASKIKKIKPPEPYKGKGIKYQGEVIRRKEGKRATTATT